MQFTKILLALVATSTFAMASPAPESDSLAKRCSSQCGSCNGSSCKFGLINYSCGHGTSCSSADGGGDGKTCEVGIDGGAICPGKA